MMSIIVVKNVSKSYGSRLIFNCIDMHLKAGVYALTGKNGSGKSTLLRLLAGVSSYDTGQVVINSVDLQLEPDRAKACIGYMPDTEEFYDFVTPRALWQLVAHARQISNHDNTSIVSMFGLGDYIDTPLGALSQGTRRKVFLVAAFLGRPAAILLDEPSNALDIAATMALCKIIKEAASDAAVFMSTHNEVLINATGAQVLELSSSGLLSVDHAVEHYSLAVVK
jgi:ABC-2 type transport system ATP-binding protein